MAVVTIDEVPRQIRDLFNKGFAAFERGNLDYAIEMMLTCLEAEPRLLQARRYLRAAEIKKLKSGKTSSMAAAGITIKALPILTQTNVLIKRGQADKAVMAAEKLLQLDPVRPDFVLLFAEAALMADLPETALQSMALARDHHPANAKLLMRLARLYAETGDTESARDVFEKLNELKPNDPETVKAYKDSMAVHSMNKDGWKKASKGGSFRDMMKDEKEAILLEQEAKAVKSDRDTDSLIVETLSKIEQEPDNINYYRALSRLYALAHRYDEAYEILGQALERSPGDPELDQALSSIKSQQFDHVIREYRDAGDEEGALDLERQKAEFELQDLEDRIRRYPNDLKLRYEYGVRLYGNGHINESIQQFQASQRSPKQRIMSLYYLALCFKDKKQYDLAAQQLKSASAELVGMDKTKKDIIYELGELHELMGDPAQAALFFKEIYQVDIGYRDVADKVEKVYGG
ncbi:MAG: tetratricopeptide repeat protein [Verrucomicrobia bacterium]|nr:tetratricopeptide repeat protein [Verrucomicrobiota bacterium]